MRVVTLVAVAFSLVGSAHAADERRDGRDAAPRWSGCDYVVRTIEIASGNQVRAWIANKGTTACGAFFATLEITDAHGNPSREREIKVLVKSDIEPGASVRVAFDVPRHVSLKTSGLRVTADKTHIKRESNAENNVGFLAPTEQAAAPATPTTPTAHPTHRAQGSATTQLVAVGIEMFKKSGEEGDYARGTVRNQGAIKYAGKREARLSRRVVFADGEGDDVVLETMALDGLPGKDEWQLIAKVPPRVAKAKGYVWMLTITPHGDAVPEDDEARLDVEQREAVRLD